VKKDNKPKKAQLVAAQLKLEIMKHLKMMALYTLLIMESPRRLINFQIQNNNRE
jgi:hypothetical protein